MTIEPIAYFHSPFKEKFGIPRQSGVIAGLRGHIEFVKPYNIEEAVRGMEDFEYLWLIWGFSANSHKANSLTVRPPRLGGNKSLGVFATRSPYRPNPLGLSSVKIESIEFHKDKGSVIHVLGADLMDGTPIYDIKPYVQYADSHPDAKSGFVDKNEWKNLHVEVSAEIACKFMQLYASVYGIGSLSSSENTDMSDSESAFNTEATKMLQEIISTVEADPRPQYHNDPERIYGLSFDRFNVRFRVSDCTAHIVDIEAGQ